ncbi:Glucose/ribitol dehydrogenase [Penicillium coprophilum]|uniref:Glucose/ribitol dehydrogenase n=1 Tax=Penicillium coprophilum TaxID=36646 RepID=UPI002399A593|nr:Glucose/ribitol dehydrogenase [Penicillium coprophilum]KAJ5170925.1 Glucose/ribitol dehydrogenase [Penicillium coprophilum]
MEAPFPSPTTKWHTKAYQSISPSRPELSAKGKTLVVTGGGTGIGSETAHHFAEAGVSRIALLGRREQPLLETKASIENKFPQIEVFVAPTDITDKDQVDAAFAKFAIKGSIDILVSNAAIIGPQEGIRNVDSDRFIGAIQENLKGALAVAQAFLRHASSDAVVIEINSSAAHVNFGPGFAAYSVAKLAVFRIWDSLAFANPDLRVFHIQPGVVDTAMNKEAGGVKATGIEDHVSLPASFCVWLASPEAKFLNGKYLWANWDVDELKAKAEEIKESSDLSIVLGGWPFQNPNWKTMWKS